MSTGASARCTSDEHKQFQSDVCGNNKDDGCTHAAHRRRLSVRRNVQPRLPPSVAEPSAARASSSAAMSWMASLLTYPHGFRERRTPVLYAVQRIWPEDSARRISAWSDEDMGSSRSRSAGSRATRRACRRPVRWSVQTNCRAEWEETHRSRRPRTLTASPMEVGRRRQRLPPHR